MSNQLHLGCGKTRMDGWVNCDLYPSDATDMCFDLQMHWPFPDGSASAIYASHVLEHLPRYVAFFREAHRVMAKGSNMTLRVPYGGSRMAWSDVTHVRPWYPESFCFLQPGYSDEVKNLSHGHMPFFQIEAAQVRIGPSLRSVLRIPLLRELVMSQIDYLDNRIDEIFVHLKPLKTEDEVNGFLSSRKGNIVPLEYCMYEHQWEGRELGDHGYVKLKPIGVGNVQWTGGGTS